MGGCLLYEHHLTHKNNLQIAFRVFECWPLKWRSIRTFPLQSMLIELVPNVDQILLVHGRANQIFKVCDRARTAWCRDCVVQGFYHVKSCDQVFVFSSQMRASFQSLKSEVHLFSEQSRASQVSSCWLIFWWVGPCFIFILCAQKCTSRQVTRSAHQEHPCELASWLAHIARPGEPLEKSGVKCCKIMSKRHG